MSDKNSVRVGVIFAIFTDEVGANNALKDMQAAKVREEIYYEDASIIAKELDGSIHVMETDDTSAGKGAGIGAVIGGVIGLIGGPAAVVISAGTGAVIGGLLAKGDAGFRDEELEEVGKNLERGSSAIIAITSPEYLEATQSFVSQYSTLVNTFELDEDLTEKWRAGEDITSEVDLPGSDEDMNEGNNGD